MRIKSAGSIAAGALAALLINGCATRYVDAPKNEVLSPRASNINLVNDQLSGEPRLLFSDGITTVMTNYRGWTDVMISKFGRQLDSMSISSRGEKILKFSVASISCTGHYVPDCTVSLQVDRGDGGRQLYTSANRTGYPMDSALEKAMNDAVQQAVGDPALSAYLSK